MSDATQATPKHIGHQNLNVAYHMDYAFRREALMWERDIPIRANFYPFGTEMRKWMLRQPNDLPVLSSAHNLFSNPYTYNASVLAYAYQFVINDGASFHKSSVPLNAYVAEIKCLRLYGENVLYTARLCEALIKQLLFCTDFSEQEYRTAALGALLSKTCSGCLSSKKKRHKLSLLGSLAHRYPLCHKYENCLEKHLPLVNKQRNLEAAHSGTADFNPKDADSVRNRFEKEMSDIGEDFIHMLQHISEIEEKMIAELSSFVTKNKQACGQSAG